MKTNKCSKKTPFFHILCIFYLVNGKKKEQYESQCGKFITQNVNKGNEKNHDPFIKSILRSHRVQVNKLRSWKSDKPNLDLLSQDKNNPGNNDISNFRTTLGLFLEKKRNIFYSHEELFFLDPDDFFSHSNEGPIRHFTSRRLTIKQEKTVPHPHNCKVWRENFCNRWCYLCKISFHFISHYILGPEF